MTTKPEPAAGRGNVVGFGLQERRLGATVLRTYRTKVDIESVVPNERQPRLGPKEDEELQRQIEANEGLFEPLLVEPHPDLPDKFRIIDGERRWTNSTILVSNGRTQYRKYRSRSPTARSAMKSGCASGSTSTGSARNGTLARRRWSPTGWSILSGGRARRTSSAFSVRELDKLVEIYELSSRASRACAIPRPRSPGRAN